MSEQTHEQHSEANGEELNTDELPGKVEAKKIDT